MDQLDDMLCFFPWVLVLLPSIVVAEFVEAEESAMLKLSVLLPLTPCFPSWLLRYVGYYVTTSVQT